MEDQKKTTRNLRKIHFPELSTTLGASPETQFRDRNSQLIWKPLEIGQDTPEFFIAIVYFFSHTAQNRNGVKVLDALVALTKCPNVNICSREGKGSHQPRGLKPALV